VELTDLLSNNRLKEKSNSVECADFLGLLWDSNTAISKTLERRCHKFLRPHKTLNKCFL
jgi:hypothetical protein